MAEESRSLFGPLPNLSVDLTVGADLRKSVTAADKACLRKFLLDLQTNAIPGGRGLAFNIWLFHVGNHIVEIRLVEPGLGIVTRIRKDITSLVTESIK